MKTRTALILTGISFLVLVVVAVAGIAVILKQPRSAQQNAASMFGSGLGILYCLVLAAIWLPWAVAFRKRRDQEQAKDRPPDRPVQRKRPAD